jgi:hypothetical protein
MGAEEGLHERVWQGVDLEKRYQTGASDLPERCLGKVLAPEDLPASDGPTVGAEASGKLADSTWRRPLPQGADQDDDGAQIDLGAEEADRRGCHSLPATVTIAAEAQSDSQWLGYLKWCAAWLSEVIGTVQASAAGTGFLAGRLGKILVNGKKHRPKPGGARQIVIHDRVLLGVET